MKDKIEHCLLTRDEQTLLSNEYLWFRCSNKPSVTKRESNTQTVLRAQQKQGSVLIRIYSFTLIFRKKHVRRALGGWRNNRPAFNIYGRRGIFAMMIQREMGRLALKFTGYRGVRRKQDEKARHLVKGF